MSTETSEKIRFLADECVGLPTIKFLRKLGYSVITAEEAGLGAKTDPEILKWAIAKGLVLVTENVEFGNILLYPPKLHHGVVLLRFRHKLEEALHATLSNMLSDLKPAEFRKTLIIIDADKYRLRKE